MIVKKNFNPGKVVWYVRVELAVAFTFALLVYLLYDLVKPAFVLPFSVTAILGSALAIFVAFRNNSSYARWWEARTLWSSILATSRIIARQIIANADNAVATGKASAGLVEQFKREMIYRQIAFAHALRLKLRVIKDYSILKNLLGEAEAEIIKGDANVPNILLMLQGKRIKEGMRVEILGPFDNISLEPALGVLNNAQSSCERIKSTPLPRQYDYYNRLFVYVFMAALPLSLTPEFGKINLAWTAIPVSVIISFVFATIGKVGEVNEDPFENKITDVPLDYICNTIERDLREMLGEKELPPALKPVKGFLF